MLENFFILKYFYEYNKIYIYIYIYISINWGLNIKEKKNIKH
ncbi:MAG: hypothetical protein N7Q72_06460 [Spiroplasma sp. Tabriz.8]|nr:hypothetical protein [Spiroplasma sp. Tabriz.8]